MPTTTGMKRMRKSGTVAAMASTGLRSTTIHLARVVWKIMSRMREAMAIPHQYAKATRYE